MNRKPELSPDVTRFLDEKKHPRRHEIDELRAIILGANDRLAENIKWNGPNFTCGGDDRITMRIHPPASLQLIFHRGARVQAIPVHRLIDEPSGLLQWKTNDRGVVAFKSSEEIAFRKIALIKIVNDWLAATCP